MHTWSDKPIKGTVVNRVCMEGYLLEIMLTVPIKNLELKISLKHDCKMFTEQNGLISHCFPILRIFKLYGFRFLLWYNIIYLVNPIQYRTCNIIEPNITSVTNRTYWLNVNIFIYLSIYLYTSRSFPGSV